MRLSVSYLIGLLLAVQGLHFSIALDTYIHREPCVAQILRCDSYRQTFSVYKDKEIKMFTKIEALREACKSQESFIRCMRRAEKYCKITTHFPIAEELLDNRRFTADVCHPDSPWQDLYLEEASCLNFYSKNAFVLCVDKIIGIRNVEHENMLEHGCIYTRVIVDCAAMVLQRKCSFYAAYILRKFLNFHNILDYKCVDFLDWGSFEVKNILSRLNHEATESVLNVLEVSDLHKEADSIKNSDFEETKSDDLESQVFPDNSPEEETAACDFEDESLTTKTEDSSSDFTLNAKSRDITIQQDKFSFPAVPNHQYSHKNRTTFALFEDYEIGYAKYVGCGEADVHWVVLSSLKNKYCTLTDVKSEYSEVIFKCTVHINAQCSPELDDKDKSKNAEVFHHGFVLTVLTPPNNQLFEDVAILNVYYLKIYPEKSMYKPEKKINLWRAQASKATTERAKPVSRKGPLESEDDYNIYQHANGSGQKRGTSTAKSPHLDEDEYYDYENSEYYPLEKEEDIYFPEALTNDIYIEDDKGGLISLRDSRSPIYSNSLYQPDSLFRPRIGVLPAPTRPQQFEEI